MYASIAESIAMSSCASVKGGKREGGAREGRGGWSQGRVALSYLEVAPACSRGTSVDRK